MRLLKCVFRPISTAALFCQSFTPFDTLRLISQATRSGRRVRRQPLRVQATPVPRRTRVATRSRRGGAVVCAGRAQRRQGKKTRQYAGTSGISGRGLYHERTRREISTPIAMVPTLCQPYTNNCTAYSIVLRQRS